MSRLSNRMGPSRVRFILLVVPMLSAVSIGLDHQVSIRVSSPAVAMAARPTRPSLTAIQRVRVTVWFQASGNVRASISRATSGAPQNTPMRPGASRRTALPMPYRTASVLVSLLVKSSTSVRQLAKGWQPAIPLASYRWATLEPVTASTIASPATAAAAAIVWARDWRQVSHIIAGPHRWCRRPGP
jgi:hypothetical protein